MSSISPVQQLVALTNNCPWNVGVGVGVRVGVTDLVTVAVGVTVCVVVVVGVGVGQQKPLSQAFGLFDIEFQFVITSSQNVLTENDSKV